MKHGREARRSAHCWSRCAPAARPDTPTPKAEVRTRRSFEDYQLAFSECMREHGIDMPDPSSDGSMGPPPSTT